MQTHIDIGQTQTRMHHRCRDEDEYITDADIYRHRTDTYKDTNTEMEMNTSQVQTYIDIG